MSRALRLFRDWGRLLVLGDEWADRAVRLAALLLAVAIAAGLNVGEGQAWFYVEVAPSFVLRWAPPPGYLLLAAVALFYLISTFGAAWVRGAVDPNLSLESILTRTPKLPCSAYVFG